MSRAILTFRLADVTIRQALVHEFSLHDGVKIRPGDPEDPLMICVETSNSPAALWDVRATIGMFDDHAIEIGVSQ